VRTLFAVDDGIWSGNYTFADVMFLVGFILFLFAAVLYYPRSPNSPPYGGVTLCIGLAAVALGFLVL